MWEIINGNQPMFYISYDGTDYQLIDGLQWQVGSGANPLRISGDYPQGNYTYSGTVTDINGCVSSIFDVYMQLNTTPTADAGPDQSICMNECVDLTASGGDTYLWNDGSTDATINVCPLSTTTYSVTVANVNGCTSSDDVTITVYPLPTADAGPDVAICEGECTSLTASGGTTYLWNNSATTASIDVCPGNTTTYAVTVTDANGCTDSDDVIVTVNPLPVADAGPDVAICDGDCTTLTASGGTTYLWNNSATTASIDVCPGNTATYTVTVTDVNGCTDSDDVIVTVNPLPVADAGPDVAICEGDCTTLTASGGVSYLWSNSATTASTDVCPATTTTYVVTVTDINGCTDSDDVIVTVNLLPVADAGPDVSICEGDCTTLTATGGLAYLWNDGNTDASVLVCPTITTTYTVTVTDLNGCTDSDDVTVFVYETPPIVNVLGGGAYCQGGNGFEITTDGSTIGFDYELYYNGFATGNIITGTGFPLNWGYHTKPGDYTIFAIYACGKVQMAGVASITVLPAPAADAGLYSVICQGESTTLNGSAIGGTAPYNYSWTPATGLSDPNISNPDASPTYSTNYTLMVTDANGCTANDNVMVIVNPAPDVDAGLDITIVTGASTVLNGFATGGLLPYTVSWTPATGLSDPGILNPVASPAATTTYTLVVTGANGCSASDNVTITVSNLPPGDYNLLGHISYDNAIVTSLNNTKVVLSNAGTGTAIDSTTSDAYGNYLFTSLVDDAYFTNGSSTKPWGGANSIDALKIMQHFVKSDTLKGIRLGAADVDNSGVVNTNDALMVMQRFVTMISSFPSGDWLFETKNVTISGADVISNFLGLCYGDVNGSNIPGAKIAPTIDLVNKGIAEINSYDEFIIPVRVSSGIDIGAISMILNYPEDMIEVMDVYLENSNRKSTEHESLLFNASDGKLSIAWYSLSPMILEADDALLYLKLRTTRKLISENIIITLYGESQLGDPEANVIQNVELNIPKLVIVDNNNSYTLKQNYPNPYIDFTNIEYQIPERGDVTLSVYNMLGEKVATLVREVQAAGYYKVRFNRSDLMSGVYFYKLEVNGTNSNFYKTRTMVISN